jgi:hypothetical protein
MLGLEKELGRQWFLPRWERRIHLPIRDRRSAGSKTQVLL